MSDNDPWEMVRTAIDALSTARNGMVLPLLDILETGASRKFHLPSGEEVIHESLAGFVEEQPNRGLGIPVEILSGLLDGSNYTRAAARLREALPAPKRAKVRIDDVDAAVWELLHYYDPDAIVGAVQRAGRLKVTDGQLPIIDGI